MSAPLKSPSLFSRPPGASGLSPHPLVAGALVVAAAAVYVTTQVSGTPQALVVIFAGVVGVYMALNIGANDVANNVGPAVGSGALTMAGALAIGVVFETAGALLAGGDVVGTISKGIVATEEIPGVASFVRLMLSALIAAALWINIATYVGAPVSTTHSIVGGVLGGAVAAAGMSSVNWPIMAKIAASWVISPVLGASVAAAFLFLIKISIVYRHDRIGAARKWVPVFVAVMGAVFSAYLLIKGLKRIWQPDGATIMVISLGCFALVYGVVKPMVAVAARRLENTREDISRLFTVPLICAAALLSFAHGSNDVANAIGPLAAIVHVAEEGQIVGTVEIPNWVMVVGAMGLAAGLALFGAKMVRRVGSEITEMDQLRAFAVALSASVTVIIASALALPVSSTHIALGAVFGVGFLREYLENRAGKVRAIRALYDDYREPMLFDTPRSELKLMRSAIEELVKDLPPEAARQQVSGVTERVEMAIKSWQSKKLVRRSHLRTIVAAWLITVPATALIAGLIYLMGISVPLPGLPG